MKHIFFPLLFHFFLKIKEKRDSRGAKIKKKETIKECRTRENTGEKIKSARRLQCKRNESLIDDIEPPAHPPTHSPTETLFAANVSVSNSNSEAVQLSMENGIFLAGM